MKKSKSRMMSGSPLLTGDNTIPGIKIHKEVKAVLPQIEKACKDMGLDYYPIIVEFVTYDEMAELASYNGFPVRYAHWRFGMEYEELSKGYEHNQYRISEMVINTDPCRIFCMDSNTLVDNVDVIAHAIGHNDFFKNNIYFEPTDRNMINKMANHGSRIDKYMSRWGYETVTEFIDQVLRIETLIDPLKAWKSKKIKKFNIKDERNYEFPERLKSTNNYMDGWVNTKDFINKQHDEIKNNEAAEFLDIFEGNTKDIFGYVKDNAPLKPWQQDIMSMIYEESMYFSPQRATKMANEGWASYVDFYLMCEEGLVSLGQKSPDCGIWHYADHKWRVLGGKYSQNPYKLGFELFIDIKDRWDKGKFGNDWENCTNMQEKKNWNKKTNLGTQKIFDVRKNYNDYTMILEFFTPEFCEKKQFFEWKRFPNGEYKIVDNKFKSIKKKLLQRYLNGGLPDIRLVDPNHLGKGWFLMQHYWDEIPLHYNYAREVMASLYKLWKNNIVISTKNKDGAECLFFCDGPDAERDVRSMSRENYEKNYLN